MNINDQFDNPMSSAEIIPVGKTLVSIRFHSRVTGFRLLQHLSNKGKV